jgi:hypothetical protein
MSRNLYFSLNMGMEENDKYSYLMLFRWDIGLNITRFFFFLKEGLPSRDMACRRVLSSTPL